MVEDKSRPPFLSAGSRRRASVRDGPRSQPGGNLVSITPGNASVKMWAAIAGRANRIPTRAGVFASFPIDDDHEDHLDDDRHPLEARLTMLSRRRRALAGRLFATCLALSVIF